MEELVESKTMNDRIDELEATMLENFEPINCPLVHRFTEGLYVREIFMPAGSLITSKIHNTQHQYFILQGKVSVWIDEGEEIFLEAPYIGVTEPGTRRVVRPGLATAPQTIAAGTAVRPLQPEEE